MADLNLFLFISIVIPLGMLLLLVTGKSRRLVLFFIFGITACLFCGELNGILVRFFESTRYFTVNISPITEEVCKHVHSFPCIIRSFLFLCSHRCGGNFEFRYRNGNFRAQKNTNHSAKCVSVFHY